MAINPLPPAPSRSNPSTFSSLMDAFLSALPPFVTQANGLAGEVNGLAGEVSDLVVVAANSADAAAQSADDATTNGAVQVALAAIQAGNAATSAVAAAGSAIAAGAVAWVSGTTYAIGDARYSTIDFQTYRRKTNGAGTTDPAQDTTNWERAIKVVGISNIVTATTATTLTSIPTLLQITPTGYGVAVTLPDATTCSVGGPLHIIDNKSSFAVFVKNTGGTIIDCIGGKTAGHISLIDRITPDGTWSVPGNSGLVLMNEAVASGAAYVTFSLSNLYDEYELHISSVASATDNYGLYLYGSNDSGATWITSGYAVVVVSYNNGVTYTFQLSSQAQFSFNIGNFLISTLQYPLSGVINIFTPGRYSPVRSELTHLSANGLPTMSKTAGQIDVGVGYSVNAIKLMFSNGDISGVFRLYGVKK